VLPLNEHALAWALTITPPGAAEYGVLTAIALRAGSDFAADISAKTLAKDLHAATNAVSRALNRLEQAGLVVIEELDPVNGVYQQGRGRRVLLNHPSAPHMRPEAIAEREADADRRAAVRASLPESMWEALQATRRQPTPEVDDEAPPMITTVQRRGLRLLTHPVSDPGDQVQRRAAQ
jgi:hypothetical protein